MAGLRTFVCIKQILDPEIPPRDFKLDATGKDADKGQGALVPGSFDLHAVELALQLREQLGGTVAAATFGTPGAEGVLRRALAMGCDEAFLIEDPGLEGPDPSLTAEALAAAIGAAGGADLVLCGRQSGDWDSGQVGPRLAEALGFPSFSLVSAVGPGAGWPSERRVEVRMEGRGGNLVLDAPLPFLATVTNAEHTRPRLPNVRSIMQAGRKPLARRSLAALGLGPEAPSAGQLEVLELSVPRVPAECEYVEAPTDEAKGVALARRLRELKRI